MQENIGLDSLRAEIKALTSYMRDFAEGKEVSVLPKDFPQHPETRELYAEICKLTNDCNDNPTQDYINLAVYKRIFDTLPIELVIMDPDLKYIYINPVAVKDIEMREWMIGRTDWDYCLERNHPRTFAEERQTLFRETIKNRDTHSIQQSMHDREGKLRHYIRRLTPVYHEDDSLEMLIGYGIEVTEIKVKEEELEVKNKILEKTSRELDQFVYRTSHDLRSPLVSILGLTNLIDLEDLSPAVSNYNDMVRTRAHKLDRVIRDIVDFSQISRQELMLEHIDPQMQIENAIDALPQHIRKDHIRIVKKVDAQTSWMADRFRTQLILTHLLNNAIKFQRPDAEEGIVQINLRVEPRQTTLIVEDNGIGIPESQKAQIFDLFFRGTHQGDGSGIGLYIVQEVLERLGGRAEVESNEGKGSVFRIYLPNFETASAEFV